MNTYQKVTESLIEIIENEEKLPWECPWFSVAQHNAHSGHIYNGMNVLLTSYAQYKHKFELPAWVTYNQAKKMGGNIKKGEKSTAYVVFFKFLDKKDINGNIEKDKNGNNKKQPWLRYSNLWNIAQTEGIDYQIDALSQENEEIRTLENFWKNMKDIPTIHEVNNGASYLPKEDSVSIPPLSSYKESIYYYQVLAHELAHSTGHPKRLDRFDPDVSKSIFDKSAYSKEELVAELTSAFVLKTLGADVPMKHTASYIKSWSAKLKDNIHWIMWASSRAQKACDYILGK